MKYPTRLLSLLILVSATVFFANCGGDDSPSKSAEEKQFDQLKFDWTLDETSVEFDGSSNDRFDGSNMTLNLSGSFTKGGTYNYAVDVDAAVDGSPWPATGQWKIASSNSITRMDDDGNVTITYSLSSDGKTLTLSFSYTGTGYNLTGRAESVEGPWEFTFTRP